MAICLWCGCGKRHAVTELLPARVELIMDEVALEHRVTIPDIVGRSRQQRYVDARACAAARLRGELKLTLRVIGVILSQRDHSSIIHLLRRAQMFPCPCSDSIAEAMG